MIGLHLPNKPFPLADLPRILATGVRDVLLYIDNPGDSANVAFWKQVAIVIATDSSRPRDLHVRIERRGGFTPILDAQILAGIVKGWPARTASWRIRNEPNLESPGESPTTWGVYLRSFIEKVRPLVPAGTIIHVPAISPGPGWQPWVQAALPYIGPGKFDALDAHVYGVVSEVHGVLAEYRLAYRGPLLVTETNYGPGDGRDVLIDNYSAILPQTLEVFERHGARPIYFIDRWVNPDIAWPTAANVADNPELAAAITAVNAVAPPPPVPIPEVLPMEIPFPTELYRSPNISTGRTEDRNLFIHSTRSGRTLTVDRKPWTLEHEYQSTIAYMMQPGTVSSDAVIGPTKVAFMMPMGDERYTWHAAINNKWSRSMEIAQPKIDTPFTDFQYRAAAWLTREYNRIEGIPIVRIMSQLQRGEIGHEDSEQGKSQGKSDPGPMWDWAKFMAYCQRDDLFDVDPPDTFNVLGFRVWLDMQPPGRYGKPRHDAREIGDGSGDLYVRLAVSPDFPTGVYLLYRKWLHDTSGSLLKAITVADWD